MPESLHLGYYLDEVVPDKSIKVQGFVSRVENFSENNTPQTRPDLISYSGTAHLMTVAPTGTGKGRSCVIPTLLTYPGSMVVLDPKGENYAITARARREMGQKVVCLNPFNLMGVGTDSFNFFDVFKLPNTDVETESQLLAELISAGNKGTYEPFWDLSAEMLLAGIFGYIVSKFPEDERKISEILKLVSDDAAYNLAVVLDTFGPQLPKSIYHNISSFLSLPHDRTAPSVLGTANAYLFPFFSKDVQKAFGTSSFSIEDFRAGEPMTIYIMVPPDKLQSHRAIIKAWTGTLLRAITSREEIPDYETLFVLDEVAQLGKFHYLYSIITLCRGYGLKCWTIWQDFQQLESNYEGSWQTLMNNSGVLQFFGSKNYQVANKIEMITGVSTPYIRNMHPDHQLLVLDGFAQVSKKLDYLKDPIFEGKFDPNPFYSKLNGLIK